MKKDNYISNTIDKINEILQKNDYRKKRYNHDIEWFNERKKQIENNILRVAIMGITSSGKSTLVNSLLGEKILPVAILPSSSIITTVYKGSSRRATIYFKDKKPKVLEGSNLNDKNIEQYACESKNPNNKFKVTQIDIESPDFLLNNNIHIIDSPGLDACNLEIHEKLTLEILLPTIDICVFLTTVKSNSDEINLEKMRYVSKKEKQLVLVQNMIDSVEEKLRKNGIIEDDKTTILKKHKKRGETLLETATNKKEFEVIQISALNALKGRILNDKELYNSSNIENFIKAVELCAEKVIPKINKLREISFGERIDNIISTDKEIINGEDDENKTLIKNIINDIDDIVYDFKISREKISSTIKIIDNVITSTIDQINKSESKEVESYVSIIEKINNKNLKLEDKILSIVKDCEDRKKAIFNKLNLDIRFDYSLPSFESESIDVKHKFEEKTRLIKKDGVLNKGKRIFSDIFETNWGYAEEAYNEKIVDKDGTIEMVKSVCDQNRNQYIDILLEWGTQYNNSLNTFYHEVNKKEEEYKKKQEQNIELKDIEEVTNNLKNITQIFKKNIIEKEIAITITSNEKFEELENCLITNSSYNLYKLSNEIIEKNYMLIGKYIKEKNIDKMQKETHQFFWTWDLDSCVKFISRINGIYLTKEELEILKLKGIYSIKNITIVNEMCKNKTQLNISLNKINKKNYNLFLMFNGIQIGNSEKQIVQSSNLKHFVMTNNLKMNLVIDSYREFVNANNIKELLISVNSLENNVLTKYNTSNKGYVLINSKNPIYNIALIEGREKKNFILSYYKELKDVLFANQLSRGKEEREILEEILSYFLNKSNL